MKPKDIQFILPGEKTPQNPRKRTKKPAPPQRDMFTALVESELHTQCVKEYRFHPVRQWRFDYALPMHKVALEVEGGVWTQGRHTRPQGFLGDIEKYNTATTMGWKVVRTIPNELYTQKTISLLKSLVSVHD